MAKRHKSVSDWHAQRKAPVLCKTCSGPKWVHAAIAEYLKLRQAGSDATPEEFWREHLRPNGYQRGITAFRRHLNECVRADG